jgi:hypothetical protein
MGTEENDTDPRESNPNASGPQDAQGGMGVSSERTGPTGPGQDSTDGARPTGDPDVEPAGETPPEQRPGNVEDNPVGIPPKAGYPSVDPRSSD